MKAAEVQAPEGLRERKKRERRQRILRAARDLFAARGYERTTVEDIAEAAYVSKATFFNHFATKSILLVEFAEEVEDRFRRLIDNELHRDCSTQERLVGFFSVSAHLITQTGEFTRTLLLEASSGFGRPGERMSKILRALEMLLREGVAQGDVRTDYSLELIVQMVAGAYNQVLLSWLVDSQYPLEDQLRKAAALIGEAVAPVDKGVEERGEARDGIQSGRGS